MDLIEEFHKAINEKNFDEKTTKKNYRKLISAIYAAACKARLLVKYSLFCKLFCEENVRAKLEKNQLIRNVF